MGKLIRPFEATRNLLPHPYGTHPAISVDVVVTCFELDDEKLTHGVSGTNWLLETTFHVRGEIDSIALPPFDGERPKRADRLWESTCFEVFYKPIPGDWYLESNVSPQRHWAVYSFDSYRQAMQPADVDEAFRIFHDEVSDGYGLLLRQPFPVQRNSRLGLSAVIEANDGTKSYWALAHPPGKPDFHHPDCFALILAPPSTA